MALTQELIDRFMGVDPATWVIISAEALCVRR